jgi:hypothetical protein
MGLLTWWATTVATATVRRGLLNASDAKLIKHYNTLQRAYQMASGLRKRTEIILLQEEIKEELQRRGLKR